MATAPSANDLTRQQLDELDALLQRMLTLPMNASEAGAAAPLPAATNWRIDPPGPVFAAAPHLIAPPLPLERERPVEPEPLAAPVARLPVPAVPPPEPSVP